MFIIMVRENGSKLIKSVDDWHAIVTFSGSASGLH